MVISTAIHMPICVSIKCEIYTMLQSRMDVQINMALSNYEPVSCKSGEFWGHFTMSVIYILIDRSNIIRVYSYSVPLHSNRLEVSEF
jgi:hypothetical protein